MPRRRSSWRSGVGCWTSRCQVHASVAVSWQEQEENRLKDEAAKKLAEESLRLTI